MFYSAELLALKNHSGLGVVWYNQMHLGALNLVSRLAATLGPRSNTKKLSRRDFGSVNIVETCNFLKAPPEPLSLRLSSNLMVGVSRIYGQLWSCYYTDVNHFFTNMTVFGKKALASIDMEVEKVPVEAITVGVTKPDALGEKDSLLMLDLDNLNLNLLNTLTITRTPEQARRSNLTSISSATRERPSIDIGRGEESKNTSLSGAMDPVIGTQFGANDEDMAFYGFEYPTTIFLNLIIRSNDDFGFIASGPESVSGYGNFLRSSLASSRLVVDPIPQKKKQDQSKKKAITAFERLWDEETMLEKEELLLGPGQGLMSEQDLRDQSFGGFKRTMTHPTVGLPVGDLFTIVTPLTVQAQTRPRPTIKSSDGASSERFVPMMDDDYGVMGMDTGFEGGFESGSGAGDFIRSGRTIEGSRIEANNVESTFKRLSNAFATCGKCDLHRLLEGKPVNRHTASQAFYDVLVMVCRDSVRVNQNIPYGPITIELR